MNAIRHLSKVIRIGDVRTIASRQAQSISKRLEENSVRRVSFGSTGYIQRFAAGDIRIKTCQWIHGEPTKQEIRLHGIDKFKCSDPAKPNSSWCESHHSICFQPLTKQPS